MKSFFRISTGSSPSPAAPRPAIRSMMNDPSGRPAPRYAAVGVLLVKAPRSAYDAAGIRYAPVMSRPQRSGGAGGEGSRQGPGAAPPPAPRPGDGAGGG